MSLPHSQRSDAAGYRQISRGLFALGCIAVIAYLAVVGLRPSPRPATGAGTDLSPEPLLLCETPDDGRLRGELFGSLRRFIDWRGDTMQCGGMSRPGGDGVRLVFSRSPLLIVLGIEGELASLGQSEHVTNVTVVDENTSRFYSSGGQERCWTSISEVTPAASVERIVQISGELYCAGSLPSVADNQSITIRELAFSGRLTLEEPR